MSQVHLEHALVDVGDLGRSLEFYGALLPDWGVRWEGRTMEGERWIHFGPPGDGQPGYLSLYESPGSARGGNDGLRIEHLGFAHPDVEALLARLEPRGIHPTERVDDGRYRRAYFEDPDGHELEFVQKLR